MPELEKVKCSTPDFAQETAKKILALLPECAGEGGAVDIEKLKQCLSSKVIEGNVERYEFTWPGKRAAKAAASAATSKTLRPCAAESVGKDGTPGGFDSENLYIEGDNLEVLKLLQTSYANQVKMIYIDPPYNTGHDFVYRDRFSLTQKEIESEAGVFDEDGNRFEVNDSAEARYHSNWCSMMYPRLKLARNLLRDDGVIFISIDDNEVTNLRKLCDEVFGEGSFITEIAWQCLDIVKNDARYFSDNHEYILVYSRDKEKLDIQGVKKGEKQRNYYKNYDNDPRGDYLLTPLHAKSGTENGIYSFTFSNGQTWTPPQGTYPRYSQETLRKLDLDHRIYLDPQRAKTPQKKTFLAEVGDRMPPVSFWSYEDFGSTRQSNKEVSDLIGKGMFQNPKPSKTIGILLDLVAASKDSLVLDFFSGSGTTAHAVMQLNAEDGGKRKFIMVQLPESCAEDSEATKAGYKTICEIGKERIRRAGKKIAEENATNAPNLDTGFRVLKLDTSSLEDTAQTVSEINQLALKYSRLKADRSSNDLLFQVLLETRLPLSEPISKVEIAGNEVFFVGGAGAGVPLVACLDAKAKLTTEFFLEIAKLKPGLAFFRDDAFADDSARTNVQQAFDQFSPSTSIKVI